MLPSARPSNSGTQQFSVSLFPNGGSMRSSTYYARMRSGKGALHGVFSRRLKDLIFSPFQQSSYLVSKRQVMAQASKGWNLVAPIASFAVVFAALTMCSAQSQSPVEYDNSGHLVPATLPHMYRYAFRAVHDLEEATKGQGPGKSARPGLRYELGLSEADFEIFEDSAIRFGQRDKDIRKQIAAIAKADWPRHPGNWVLSQKARTQVHALLAKGEDDLANELVTLKAGLSPQSAVALDARVTRLYAITLVVPPGAGNRSPQSANPAQPKTPAQQRNSSSPSSADQPGQPAATETCPTCPVPTGNNMLNFSPDGTTVNANFYYEIPQADADAGCIPSGVFSIDSGGAAVATDNVDGAGGAVLDDTVSTTVSVGSTYNPAGSVQSCDALGTCSTPTLIVGTGFPTGAPAITAISPSSASLGQSGNTTLTGTLLGGPPGDVPTVSVTSGTGLDLETTQPATYGTGDTGASTQMVEYTVDSNATVGSDTFQ